LKERVLLQKSAALNVLKCFSQKLKEVTQDTITVTCDATRGIFVVFTLVDKELLRAKLNTSGSVVLSVQVKSFGRIFSEVRSRL